MQATVRRPSRRVLILLVALGAFVLALPFLVALGAGALAVHEASYSYASNPQEPGVRQAESYDRSSCIRHEWREIQRSDGSWVKDGPSVRWSREGKKLDKGSYRNGEREGEWTFWNDDGAIDLVRSGIYENDVRVQAGATPPGDYRDDGDRRR